MYPLIFLLHKKNYISMINYFLYEKKLKYCYLLEQ